MTILRQSVALALLLCVASCAAARAQSVDADRPGLLAATTVVGRGRVQLESGVQRSWTTNADSATSLLNVPTMVRIGVSERWELQVGDTLINRVSDRVGVDTQSGRGWGDLSLGVKTAHEGSGRRPGIVAYGTIGVPTGSDAFSSGALLASTLLQLTWDLSERVSVGGVGGYAHALKREAGTASGLVGGSIGVALPGDWATYVEVGAFPVQGGPDSGTVGGGVTRIVRERVQFDASLNRGIHAPSARWTFGAGVSVLF